MERDTVPYGVAIGNERQTLILVPIRPRQIPIAVVSDWPKRVRLRSASEPQRSNPPFGSLEGDPRFKAFLRKMNLPD
jgi:hypothetical protein